VAGLFFDSCRNGTCGNDSSSTSTYIGTDFVLIITVQPQQKAASEDSYYQKYNDDDITSSSLSDEDAALRNEDGDDSPPRPTYRPPSPPSADSTTSRSVVNARLETLRSMKGLVSEEEYKRKEREIIDSVVG